MSMHASLFGIDTPPQSIPWRHRAAEPETQEVIEMDDVTMELDLDFDDYRDNFIERYSDLEEFDLVWHCREELQEALCQRVNEGPR